MKPTPDFFKNCTIFFFTMLGIILGAAVVIVILGKLGEYAITHW